MRPARLGGTLPVGLLALVLLLAAGAWLFQFGAAPAPATRSAAHDVRAYADAVAAVTAPAGQVVDTDMKPSVVAWETGSLPAATLAERARGWSLMFHRARQALTRVAPPAGLQAAQQGFLGALDQYAGAADLFAAAASGPAPGGADAATAAARAADRSYDSASRLLQGALKAAGLPADFRFAGAPA